MYLMDIADIRMGYTYRGSLKQTTSGKLSTIQLKDATPEGILPHNALARINFDNLPEHYLLRQGDLIFRARGTVNNAILIKHDIEQTICIAPLMVIRLQKQETILPAYLQWFINLPTTQTKLTSFARGTRIRMIPVRAMVNLKIVLPSLERQQKIMEIVTMNEQYNILEKQLAEKRALYTNESLLRYAKGTKAI